MITYFLIDELNKEVYRTTDYADAVHYTIVHPNTHIKTFTYGKAA